MAKTVTFTPEAEDDSYQGYAWYESRRIGLGREFITAVDACLQSISRNPKLYQAIYKDYRRAAALPLFNHLRRNGFSRYHLRHFRQSAKPE